MTTLTAGLEIMTTLTAGLVKMTTVTAGLVKMTTVTAGLEKHESNNMTTWVAGLKARGQKCISTIT